MPFTISKDFTFSASHRLSGLRPDHPCARLHGHNYVVRVEVTVPSPTHVGPSRLDALDRAGMVTDYANLAPFGDHLARVYDHRHLNDLMPRHRDVRLGRYNPTAEVLAWVFSDAVGELCELPEAAAVGVGVSETPRTWAWVI